MANGLYVYETDKGRRYAVRLDDAIGLSPLFGFVPLGESDLDGLPRNMQVRTVGCYSAATKIYRRFPVGKKTAPVYKVLAEFTYKGLNYIVSRFTPESSRL